MKRNRLNRFFIVGLFLVLFLQHIIAQEETNPRVIDLNSIENDLKREEVQRYFGYENLLFRYFTLPYDISVNVNQQGRFVDIGFFLLALLPLGLMGIFYNKKKVFYSLATFFLFYLAVSVSYSFVITDNFQQTYTNQAGWDDLVNNKNKSIAVTILTSTFGILNIIAQPIKNLGESISGNKDDITYPILFFSLLLSLFVVFSTKSVTKEVKVLLTLFITYGFLWLVLSAGIIWYGFLIFPLGLALLFRMMNKISDPAKIFFKRLAIGTLAFWALLAYVSRISNIYQITNGVNPHLGKSIVDGNIMRYSTGISTAIETRNAAYSNLSDALDQLNSTDDIIYQIGTSFSFEVKNNHLRVYEDNTLGVWFKIVSEFKDKEIIADVLRASNVRYMVIDLNTHTIDKTPEQSLRKKFELLLNTVINNPKMKLLATDRVVSYIDENGQKQLVANVFLMNRTNSKIEEIGSYAIYEIN